MKVEKIVNEQSNYLVKVYDELVTKFDFINTNEKCDEFSKFIREMDRITLEKKNLFFKQLTDSGFEGESRRQILYEAKKKLDQKLDVLWNTYIKEEQEKRIKKLKEEDLEKSMWVEVDGVKYRAIKKLDVLWHGWESDNTVWLVNINGEKKVITTNHGQVYVADESLITEKIAEYAKLIKDSQDFLNLMKQ